MEGVFKISLPSRKQIPRTDVHYVMFRQVSGGQTKIFQQFEEYLENREFDQLCQQHIDDDEPCDSTFTPCFVCDGWKSGPVKSTDENF
jgi:hypothetical protein